MWGHPGRGRVAEARAPALLAGISAECALGPRVPDHGPACSLCSPCLRASGWCRCRDPGCQPSCISQDAVLFSMACGVMAGLPRCVVVAPEWCPEGPPPSGLPATLPEFPGSGIAFPGRTCHIPPAHQEPSQMSHPHGPPSWLGTSQFSLHPGPWAPGNVPLVVCFGPRCSLWPQG